MIKLTDTLQETAKLAEIARQCNITRSAVSQWDQVPAKHVLTVESVTGISRHDLRPDIYGPSASAQVDEADTNSPVGSSAGNAGASLPPSGAPASFKSPEVLPSGVKAEARRDGDAGCASASSVLGSAVQ